MGVWGFLWGVGVPSIWGGPMGQEGPQHSGGRPIGLGGVPVFGLGVLWGGGSQYLRGSQHWGGLLWAVGLLWAGGSDVAVRRRGARRAV